MPVLEQAKPHLPTDFCLRLPGGNSVIWMECTEGSPGPWPSADGSQKYWFRSNLPSSQLIKIVFPCKVTIDFIEIPFVKLLLKYELWYFCGFRIRCFFLSMYTWGTFLINSSFFSLIFCFSSLLFSL